MITVRFDSPSVATFNNNEYLMLRLVDYPEKQKARKFVAEAPEQKHVAELKVHRNKRSLNANAYCWSIITEIANILRYSKEDVYVDMLKRYGQSEIASVKSGINVSGYFKYYEEAGTGSVNGVEFTHYKVFKGSSEYDTREMSILIDGIVDEAKTMGIETLTPNELARLTDEWGRNDKEN